MAVNLTPLHDRVIVKRIEEKESVRGGIIIPDSAKEKPMEGEIIAVGAGKREKGELIPLDVKRRRPRSVRQVQRHRNQNRRRRVPHSSRRRDPCQTKRRSQSRQEVTQYRRAVSPAVRPCRGTVYRPASPQTLSQFAERNQEEIPVWRSRL